MSFLPVGTPRKKAIIREGDPRAEVRALWNARLLKRVVTRELDLSRQTVYRCKTDRNVRSRQDGVQHKRSVADWDYESLMKLLGNVS